MYTAVHAFWSLKTPSKFLNHIIGAICTLGETTCSLLCLIIYASEPEYHVHVHFWGYSDSLNSNIRWLRSDFWKRRISSYIGWKLQSDKWCVSVYLKLDTNIHAPLTTYTKLKFSRRALRWGWEDSLRVEVVCYPSILTTVWWKFGIGHS